MSEDQKEYYAGAKYINYMELLGIRAGFVFMYCATPWYRPFKKATNWIAIGVCDTLLDWLDSGKPKQEAKTI